MARHPVLARALGPRRLKRWLPRTLWGRSLLIIVLPVALMQVAVTWFFFNVHAADVTARLSEGLAGNVAWVVRDYERDPGATNLAGIAPRAESTFGLSIVRQPGAELPQARRRAPFFSAADRTLEGAFEQALDQPFWFDSTRYPNYVDIRVKTPDGVLKIIANSEDAFATQGWVFLAWMIGATLILTAVAILFIRNQVRAIERLAAAADAFGRGADVSAFKPHGALEVRQAALAFFDMKDRISKHLEQRTALLASVSHDLRTPLTRLKLELALAEPHPRVTAMAGDLSEMEYMIDEYLDFARGEGAEASEVHPIAPLIEAVADGARRAGATVTVEVDPDLSANVRPNAVKRALANLIGNAAVHGDEIEVSVRSSPEGEVEIVIDDDGPGIEPELREEAFKPFSRLDAARNQNQKGVGLGLAIARDVARAHGGDVELSESPLGGLRAIVRLPA